MSGDRAVFSVGGYSFLQRYSDLDSIIMISEENQAPSDRVKLVYGCTKYTSLPVIIDFIKTAPPGAKFDLGTIERI
jgi:hypothetical protein